MEEEILNEAFQLFEEAEEKIDHGLESISLFRRAVSNLLKVYLFSQGVERRDGMTEELYRECVKINPEFESIKLEVDYLFNVAPDELDGEELIDKANEIWDFIQGLLMEDEIETDNY